MRTIPFFASLFFCIFFVGCSGRTPDLALTYSPGDGALSCEELHVEMAEVKRDIALNATYIKEREARNRGLFCFGFLIYPLFEIDTLRAEESEIQALNARYNNLFMIAVDRKCPFGNNQMTVKIKGGRDVTADDILKDELPPKATILSSLGQ